MKRETWAKIKRRKKESKTADIKIKENKLLINEEGKEEKEKNKMKTEKQNERNKEN